MLTLWQGRESGFAAQPRWLSAKALSAHHTYETKMKKHMNTKLNNIIGFGLCLAAALALVTGTATNALADEVKTAKGGASELLKLKPIKTASDIDALKEGDSVVMSCPKCKTVTVTR